jgi:hypothetical protein
MPQQAPAAAPQQQPGPPPAADTAPQGSTGSTQKILGWTSLGLGAVGLGVGTVFLIQRQSKLNDRDTICPDMVLCTDEEIAQNDTLTDEARTASTIGTIGLAAGGVLAVTGVVLLLTAPKGKPKESVALVPVVGPGFQGLSFQGKL